MSLNFTWILWTNHHDGLPISIAYDPLLLCIPLLIEAIDPTFLSQCLLLNLLLH